MKGFIGPIGDDLPSIISIVLALGIFFTALSFTFDTYNQKVVNFQIMKGSIDVSRRVIQNGVINEPLKNIAGKTRNIARSYGIDFALEYWDGSDSALSVDRKTCAQHDDWMIFNYLVPVKKANIELKTLRVCVG